MNQYTNRPMAQPRKTKPSIDKTGRILLAAFAVIGLILAFVGGKFVYNLVKGWSLTSLPGAPVTSNVAPSSNSTITPGSTLQTSNAPAAASWDGKSRVNILLLGLDYTEERAVKEPGPNMSDTMILVTIDPMTKTLGALSIRRDLWVNVPGHDYNKINKAYWWGEVDNLPGVGGAGLAMQTVEEFLGVPINFYARVDFNTFVRLVDEVGGVTIDIKERMLIDPNHTGSPFWLEPGVATLPGNYLLEYARNRSTSDGDIDRGRRQMEVVTSLFQKIVSKNMMPQLISRAPVLYQELSSGVQTNMTLGQAIQLGLLFVQIPQANFKTYNITYDHASPEMIWTESGEQYVLRPFMDKVRLLRDEIFVQDTTAAAPITISTQTGQDVSNDPLSLAKAENARVEVLNGTASGGLADSTSAYLTAQGLNIVATGNASENYTYTTVVVHNATPYSLAYLSSLMGGIPTNRIYNRYEPDGSVDITIYLGSDWADSNTIP